MPDPLMRCNGYNANDNSDIHEEYIENTDHISRFAVCVFLYMFDCTHSAIDVA